MQQFLDYLNRLSPPEQRDCAQRCGTTIGYLRKAAAVGQRIRARVCVALERESAGAITRRDLRPDDWREIWPELEEVERLRTQVAQLMERLRKYEPVATPALSPQAPAAINSEARQQAQEALT